MRIILKHKHEEKLFSLSLRLRVSSRNNAPFPNTKQAFGIYPHWRDEPASLLTWRQLCNQVKIFD